MKHSGIARGVVASVGLFVVSVVALVAFDAAPQGARTGARRAGPRSLRLDTERVIDGVACVTRVFFDVDGRLLTCTLARETTFDNGLTLPAGSQVSFRDRVPEMAFLPTNTRLDGHLCVGTGTHDAMTNFHPNGRLRFCNLADAESIGGVQCQRSSFWIWVTQGGSGTYFHDNGALHKCLLAADGTVDGRPVQKRSHVTLDRDGHLEPR